jgi:hypothetical protein
MTMQVKLPTGRALRRVLLPTALFMVCPIAVMATAAQPDLQMTPDQARQVLGDVGNYRRYNNLQSIRQPTPCSIALTFHMLPLVREWTLDWATATAVGFASYDGTVVEIDVHGELVARDRDTGRISASSSNFGTRRANLYAADAAAARRLSGAIHFLGRACRG